MISSTERLHRMWQRKWRETKHQPSMFPGQAVPGCCLVSFHFLCYILWSHSVPYHVSWSMLGQCVPHSQQEFWYHSDKRGVVPASGWGRNTLGHYWRCTFPGSNYKHYPIARLSTLCVSLKHVYNSSLTFFCSTLPSGLRLKGKKCIIYVMRNQQWHWIMWWAWKFAISTYYYEILPFNSKTVFHPPSYRPGCSYCRQPGNNP